jgi:hypothetical protein
MALKATAASAATTPPPDTTTTPEAAAAPAGDGAPTTDAPDTAQVPETAPDGPEWGNWRYTGPTGRVYTAVPVTPEPGDVVTYCGPPAEDGCWEPTDATATRRPDNWRPDLPDPVEPGGEG